MSQRNGPKRLRALKAHPLSCRKFFRRDVARLLKEHGHELRGYFLMADVPSKRSRVVTIWSTKYWLRRRDLMGALLDQLVDVIREPVEEEPEAPSA